MHSILREWIPVLTGCCCLLLGQWAWSAVGDLEARIQEAEKLNLTAPREESGVLIDELGSELEQASPEQRARIIFLQARNMALAGDYQRGLDLLEPLYEQDLHPNMRLKILRLSANIALQQDHFEQAYRFLRQGLDLLPRADAPGPKTNLLASLAYFYGSAGEGEKAIEYGNQALSVARSSDDPRNECVALHDLSVAQERAGRIEAALESRRQALEVCESARDPVHVGASMVSLGKLLFELHGDEEAIRQIRSGIERLEESGYRDGILWGRLALAEILEEKGETAEAEALVRPLVDEFGKLEYWANVSDSHRLLMKIAESRGEYRQALEHKKAEESASNRVLDRERAMRVAYLQVELDTRQKEQQIELLREQNQVLELRDESQRQRRYLTLGGATAMTVIGLLLLLLLLRTRSDRRHLLWLSQHDGLTGLRNHGSFFRRANEALDVTQKADALFTLVVADIDYFKAINDKYGHIAGDAVLRDIGRLLREVFEPQGIVGRIGGEEFAIALPGNDRERARELIQEMNERLNPVHDNGGDIDITLSYGLAEASENATVEVLRLYADRALYEAKRRGRNRIVDAAEITDDPELQPKRRADDAK